LSQYFVTTESGPSPPDVPTTFQTEDGDAVPALNILNLLTDSTIDNFDDGITNDGSGNTVTHYLTNRTVQTATTSDGGGQSQSVTLFTPVDDKGFTYRVLVNGYDATNNETAGGELIGMGRKEAGAVTVISDNDVFSDSDAGLASADWNIVANGADVDMDFTGVAGRSIVWKVLFEYIQSP
jgi:hypothetical protein